jgi:hypothetical protein
LDNKREELIYFSVFIFLIVFLNFGGLRIRQLGFTLDDWGILSPMTFAEKGVSPLINSLKEDMNLTYFRPLQAYYFSILFAIFKLAPVYYHICSIIIITLTCFTIFLIFRDLFNNDYALCLALLIGLYPVHDSTCYWVAGQPIALSVLFFLLFVYFFLKGFRNTNFVNLHFLLSILFYILSVITYQSTTILMFLLFMLLFTKAGRTHYKNIIFSLILYTGILLVFGLYSFQFVPWLTGHSFPKTIKFWPISFYLNLYLTCIDCNLGLAFFKQILLSNISHFELFKISLSEIALFVIALSMILIYIYRKEHEQNEFNVIIPKLKLVGYFILSILITMFASFIVLTGNMGFRINSIDNRVLLVPSLGFGLLVGLVFIQIGELLKKQIAVILFFITILSFTVANIQNGNYWRQAENIRSSIKSGIIKNKFQSSPTVLLYLEKRVFNHAHIFEAYWDWGNAIKIWFNDPSISGVVITKRMNLYNKDFLSEPYGPILQYGNKLYLYDYNSKKMFHNPSKKMLQDYITKSHELIW